MRNKRKKRKQIPPQEVDDCIDRFKSKISEAVAAVIDMDTELKLIAWKMWQTATETLRYHIELLEITDNSQQVLQVDQCTSNQFKNSENQSNILCQTNNQSIEEPVKLAAKPPTTNINDLLEEMQTEIQKYDSENLGQSTFKEPKAATSVDDVESSGVSTNLSRRSTRKRQVTAKAQELQENRRQRKNKNKSENDPRKSRDRTTKTDTRIEPEPANQGIKSEEREDKPAVCEVIPISLEATEHPGEILIHADVSESTQQGDVCEERSSPTVQEGGVAQENIDTVVGGGTTETGDTETVVGGGTNETGDTETMVGGGTTESGETDTVFGGGTTETGDTETVAGGGTIETGETDTVVGGETAESNVPVRDGEVQLVGESNVFLNMTCGKSLSHNSIGSQSKPPETADTSSQNTGFPDIVSEGDPHIVPVSIEQSEPQCEVMVTLDQPQSTSTQPVTCQLCDETFQDEKSLKKHKRSKHRSKRRSANKSTKCEECGKTFYNSSNLNSHINLCHKGKRDFICDVCRKEFHTKSNLQRHRLTHTGWKPWKCNKCDASFTEKKSMQRHAMIHTGLKLYKCDTCGKSLSTAWSLKQHQAQHADRHSGSFLCDVCGKTFVLKNNLRSHKKIHLSQRSHPCTLCKRSFYAKGDLDRHLRSHTGEKPYDCQVCNKRFSRLEYLREHLNAHAGIMPYSCPTCNKGFTDRSGYHKHSKRCALKKRISLAEDEDEEDEDEQEQDEDEEDDLGVDPQGVDVDLDHAQLEAEQNQVNFIGLDPQSVELQVHQIFCTNQEAPNAVAAEHVIEVAPTGSTYTVLSDDHVTGSAMDFVHQTAPLSVEGAVETIQNEAQLTTANLQWYVQDVVNTEPWQSIG